MNWRNQIDENERIEGIRLSHLPQAGKIARMGDRYIQYWPDGNRTHVRAVNGEPEELVCTCHENPSQLCRHEAALCLQLERLHLLEVPKQPDPTTYFKTPYARSSAERNPWMPYADHQPEWNHPDHPDHPDRPSRSASRPDIHIPPASLTLPEDREAQKQEDLFRDMMEELFGLPKTHAPAEGPEPINRHPHREAGRFPEGGKPEPGWSETAAKDESAPTRQPDHPDPSDPKKDQQPKSPRNSLHPQRGLHLSQHPFHGHFGRMQPNAQRHQIPIPASPEHSDADERPQKAPATHPDQPKNDSPDRPIVRPQTGRTADEQNRPHPHRPFDEPHLPHPIHHEPVDEPHLHPHAVDEHEPADDGDDGFVSFRDFLESFSRQELIDEIESYAFRHPDLKDALIAAKAEEYPEEILNYLEFEADRRLNAFLGVQSHVPARSMHHAIESFMTWMSMSADALCKVQEDQYAIDLLESVLVTLESFASVRNEAAIRQIGDFLFEYLEQIASMAHRESIEDLHAWIELAVESHLLPDFRMDLIRLLERPCFELESLAVPRFRLLVRLFETMRQEGRSNRILRPLVRPILRLEKELSLLEEEGAAFEKQYGHLPIVRLERAKAMMSESNWRQAAHLLESCRSESLSENLEEEVLRDLMTIYRRMGVKEKEQAFARRLIFDLHRADVSDLERFASMEDEEDLEKDLRVLEESGESELLIEYYDRSGQDEKLLSIIESAGAIHHLEDYASRLARIDENRVADLWLKQAKDLAGRLHERDTYRQFAWAIHRAADAETNREDVQALVQEVKEKNRRKKALLSELELVGY